MATSLPRARPGNDCPVLAKKPCPPTEPVTDPSSRSADPPAADASIAGQGRTASVRPSPRSRLPSGTIHFARPGRRRRKPGALDRGQPGNRRTFGGPHSCAVRANATSPFSWPPTPPHPKPRPTLSDQQLQALPLAGRHWEDFVLDSPAMPGPNPMKKGPRRLRQPAGARLPSPSTAPASGWPLAAGPGGRMRSSSLMGPGANEAAISEVRTYEKTSDPADESQGEHADGRNPHGHRPVTRPGISFRSPQSLGSEESFHAMGEGDFSRTDWRNSPCLRRFLTPRPITKTGGALAWAAASSTASCSGLPPTTARSATILASPP